jgi:hypothetical protein
MLRARDTTTSKGLLNAVAKMPPKTPDLPKGRENQRSAQVNMRQISNQNFNAMGLSLLMPAD